MAGHSKWANIKRKKEANDKVKGKMFAKLSRQITMAIVESGGMNDPEFNVKLRLAIEKAKQHNMPKESMQRAIEKGSGSTIEHLSPVQYEVFGPSGSAFLIIGSTDNANRTAAEIRTILYKHNGKLAAQGSVGYLFQQCGFIQFDAKQYSEESLFQFADSIKSFDFQQDGEEVNIYFPFDKLGEVKNVLGNLVPTYGPEETYKTITAISIENREEQDKIISLIEALEELDDIESVYTNAEFHD